MGSSENSPRKAAGRSHGSFASSVVPSLCCLYTGTHAALALSRGDCGPLVSCQIQDNSVEKPGIRKDFLEAVTGLTLGKFTALVGERYRFLSQMLLMTLRAKVLSPGLQKHQKILSSTGQPQSRAAFWEALCGGSAERG